MINLLKRNKYKIGAVIVGLVAVGLLIFVLVRGSGTKNNSESNVDETVISENENTENVEEENLEKTEEEPKEVVESDVTVKPEPQTWPVNLTMEQASDLLVVVNKKHKLPSEYAPNLTGVNGGQLRPEAATALAKLMTDASNAGAGMKIISSYRSYSTQVSTYNKWVNLQGQAEADRSSARPGHSEHQTGLAVDLGVPSGNCDLLICFGTTSQGIWLKNNAHKYGFIVRYPEGQESATGYQYEPWHMRYLGVDVATAVYNSGKTLDQYYNVPAGDYQ